MGFGFVLHDSTSKQYVTLTNPGRVPVEYSWAWLKTDGGAYGHGWRRVGRERGSEQGICCPS